MRSFLLCLLLVCFQAAFIQRAYGEGYDDSSDHSDHAAHSPTLYQPAHDPYDLGNHHDDSGHSYDDDDDDYLEDNVDGYYDDGGDDDYNDNDIDYDYYDDGSDDDYSDNDVKNYDAGSRDYNGHCPLGYRSNGAGSCMDDDECRYDVDNTCGRHANCFNTDGSYLCLCHPGYDRNYHGDCVDVDECEDYSHKCAKNERCYNKHGSYKCVCDTGYTREGYNGCKPTRYRQNKYRNTNDNVYERVGRALGSFLSLFERRRSNHKSGGEYTHSGGDTYLENLAGPYHDFDSADSYLEDEYEDY